MDKKQECLIKYLKERKKDAEKHSAHMTSLMLSADEIDYLINNSNAVDKLKNENKTMVEERLTEVCDKIAELKVEENRILSEMQFANTIHQNNRIWKFNHGLY